MSKWLYLNDYLEPYISIKDLHMIIGDYIDDWDCSGTLVTPWTSMSWAQCACACPLKDGRLAVGVDNGCIQIFETQTYEWQSTLIAHQAKIEAMVQLSDGRLISGSVDRTIGVWDL